MTRPSPDPRESHREINDSELIADDKVAEARYEQWKAVDPFPDVTPALLHSGQIRDYILKTGMLAPFGREDLANIKPASIEIPFEGQVVYWDENQEKRDNRIIASDDSSRSNFTLRRNSIAFVQVRPKFRLPYYIAIRFNLKITHVYRGLLLGTGPLVDPGYQGDLYIPLHNLTNNDYEFTAGEGLLWMEFTKLQWTDDGRNKVDQERAPSESQYPEGYKPFPASKINLPLHAFFEKANNNRPIPSSIPQEIKKATDASEDSARASKKSADWVKWLSGIGIAGVVVIVASLGSLLQGSWQLTSEVIRDIGGEQVELRQEIEALSSQVEEDLMRLRAELDRLKVQDVDRGVGKQAVDD